MYLVRAKATRLAVLRFLQPGRRRPVGTVGRSVGPSVILFLYFNQVKTKLFTKPKRAGVAMDSR